MLGRQSPQMDLADAVLWTGKIEPGQLVEKGSFHDRFAKLRPTVLRDEDFEHWFNEETGRPSVAPSGGGTASAPGLPGADRQAACSGAQASSLEPQGWPSEPLLRAAEDPTAGLLERCPGQHRAADRDWPGRRQLPAGGDHRHQLTRRPPEASSGGADVP